MNRFACLLRKYALLQTDLDYQLIRVALIVVFFFFGYQKWFPYEAQALIPIVSHGPLVSWLYVVFQPQGASYFVGVWEGLVCLLLLASYRNQNFAALASVGAIVACLGSLTTIPFMPDAWEPTAGGFPAQGGHTPLLIKDIVLLAASVYLLKQSLIRVSNDGPIVKALRPIALPAGLLSSEFDYHFLRAAMALIFITFGYDKWFDYAAKIMVIYISHGPLIFWLYPAFGFRGESRFLGTSELTTFTLLVIGFWNKKVGMVAALLSTFTFISTITILPFIPGGWEGSAGGFPAMTGETPFLLKDLVLLAVSYHLLKEDVTRVIASETAPAMPSSVAPNRESLT
jgi:uncharacterized membrane protein YkgB